MDIPPSCHCQLLSTAAALKNSREESPEARGQCSMPQPRSHTDRDGIPQILYAAARRHQTHSKYSHEILSRAIRTDRQGRAHGCYLPSPCPVVDHHLSWRNPAMLQLLPACPHHWWHSGSCPDDSPSDPWPELPNLPAQGSWLEHKQENPFSNPPETQRLHCSSHGESDVTPISGCNSSVSQGKSHPDGFIK